MPQKELDEDWALRREQILNAAKSLQTDMVTHQADAIFRRNLIRSIVLLADALK